MPDNKDLTTEEKIEIKTRKYPREQYKEEPLVEVDTGFTNYDRLLIELNNKQYFAEYEIEKNGEVSSTLAKLYLIYLFFLNVYV